MKKTKIALSLGLLLLSGAFFIYYMATDPELIERLLQTNLLYVGAILLLYFCIMICLSAVLVISVQLCQKTIKFKPSLGITTLSAAINFFGPLQGGLGVRTVYLKKKLGLSIKRYGIVTLYYFAFYAVFSALFLLIGSAKYRLPLVLFVLVCAFVASFYIHYLSKKAKLKPFTFQSKLLALLATCVFIQVSLTALIYYLELSAINSQATISQAISYTGAANFSLFVALTPGAIGIREAFLVFAESLHSVNTADVISASILDRALYVLFLAIALLVLWLTHTKDKLQLPQTNQTK